MDFHRRGRSAWKVLFVIFNCLYTLAVAFRRDCPVNAMAKYKLEIRGTWTEASLTTQLFPKGFPERWTWATGIGVSLDGREDPYYNETVKSKIYNFIKKGGLSNTVSELSRAGSGVLDMFLIPKMESSGGEVTTEFFIDSNHSRVSFMNKMNHKPHWLLSVDSVNLCHNGEFRNSFELDIFPTDNNLRTPVVKTKTPLGPANNVFRGQHNVLTPSYPNPIDRNGYDQRTDRNLGPQTNNRSPGAQGNHGYVNQAQRNPGHTLVSPSWPRPKPRGGSGYQGDLYPNNQVFLRQPSANAPIISTANTISTSFPATHNNGNTLPQQNAAPTNQMSGDRLPYTPSVNGRNTQSMFQGTENYPVYYATQKPNDVRGYARENNPAYIAPHSQSSPLQVDSPPLEFSPEGLQIHSRRNRYSALLSENEVNFNHRKARSVQYGRNRYDTPKGYPSQQRTGYDQQNYNYPQQNARSNPTERRITTTEVRPRLAIAKFTKVATYHLSHVPSLVRRRMRTGESPLPITIDKPMMKSGYLPYPGVPNPNRQHGGSPNTRNRALPPTDVSFQQPYNGMWPSDVNYNYGHDPRVPVYPVQHYATALHRY